MTPFGEMQSTARFQAHRRQDDWPKLPIIERGNVLTPAVDRADFPPGSTVPCRHGRPMVGSGFSGVTCHHAVLVVDPPGSGLCGLPHQNVALHRV